MKFNSISSVLSKPDSSSTSKGFGCRVRFPIYSCSFVRGKEDEDEGESKGMEVKREEENKNGEGKIGSSSEKKDEDTSLNLGLGVGLMLLLSKRTNEVNKMMELRKEMEALLIDLKNEVKNRNVPTSTDNSHNAPISFSSSGGNENENHENASCLVDDRLDKSFTDIDEMEAELEAEFNCLQLSEESQALPPLLTGEIEPINSDSFEEYTNFEEQPVEAETNEEEEEGDNNGDYNSFNGGVCPLELEKRLNEVLQSRQRERIEELEFVLECAKQKLHEKEREICWWQDTARLVTQHKDDTHVR